MGGGRRPSLIADELIWPHKQTRRSNGILESPHRLRRRFRPRRPTDSGTLERVNATTCASLLACCWLSACGQGGCVVFHHPVAPDGGPCRFEELRFERFLTVGEQAQVEFGLDENCYADIQEVFPVRLTAVVEVFDPTGKSVPHTDAEPERRMVGSSHFEDAVKVTFTPDRPGTWRLSADFGAEFGKTVQDIEVVHWRGHARDRVIRWSVPPDCLGYELTDQATALCLQFTPPSASMPFALSVATSRGQVIEGTGFAVSGNVLWRLTSTAGASSVERLEDDGTAFSVTHSVFSPFATAGALAASSNEAWLFGNATAQVGPLSLLSLTPEQDGGISFEETPVPGRFALGVALGTEANLLFTDHLALAVRDGGLVSLEETGRLVGADPGALWFEDNTDPLAPANSLGGPQELKVAWAEAGGLRTATLPLPRQHFLNTRRRFHFGAPVVPMSAVSVGPDAPTVSFAFPRLEGARISLESFDAGPDFEPVSAATARHAFARSLDGGELKIFDR